MMLSENKYEGRYQTRSLKMKAGSRCHLVMSSIETGKRVITKQTTHIHTKYAFHASERIIDGFVYYCDDYCHRTSISTMATILLLVDI